MLSNDVLAQISASVREEIMKAAEVKTTYAFSPDSRSVFSPENLAADIKILSPIDTPLRNRIPRIQGKGEAAAWIKMTSRLHSKTGGNSVAGAGTNQSIAFADAGAPNETAQTYAKVSAPYKLLGRKVEVGMLAQAASQGGTSMLEERERVKIYETMLGEEELLIQGDSALNSAEFDGLLKQITTYSGTLSLLTSSGIGVYCQTLADAEGAYPQLLLAAGRQIRALADDLQGAGSIQRIMLDAQGNAVGGVRLASIINPVNGTVIEVAHDRYMADKALLLTMTSPAGEPWMQIEDLIPMSRIDVPSSNASFIRFIVQAEVLKLIGEPFQYKIGGLATS